MSEKPTGFKLFQRRQREPGVQTQKALRGRYPDGLTEEDAEVILNIFGFKFRRKKSGLPPKGTHFPKR